MTTGLNTKPCLAWSVSIKGYTVIAFAPTRAAAQMAVTQDYWDAFGRGKREWPRATAWRAEVYDKSPLAADPKRKVWDEEQVMNSLPAHR